MSLVLIMVLILATSAQAALSLSLTATGVGVGSDVTLNVSSDNADIWAGYLILSEDIVHWTDPVAYAFDGPCTINTNAGDMASASPTAYSAAYFLQAAGIIMMPQAGIQFSINIKGVQAGGIYIDLQNYSDFSEMATNGPLLLIPIPEPMTIGLLGFGVLFLRRRK